MTRSGVRPVCGSSPTAWPRGECCTPVSPPLPRTRLAAPQAPPWLAGEGRHRDRRNRHRPCEAIVAEDSRPRIGSSCRAPRPVHHPDARGGVEPASCPRSTADTRRSCTTRTAHPTSSRFTSAPWRARSSPTVGRSRTSHPARTMALESGSSTRSPSHGRRTSRRRRPALDKPALDAVRPSERATRRTSSARAARGSRARGSAAAGSREAR